MPEEEEEEEVTQESKFSEEEKIAILEKFYYKLLASQVDVDPEIQTIINDNFYDLL